ncbi:MAG: hypothetical protein ABSG68_23600 [Thermoguttaceae bacterium]
MNRAYIVSGVLLGILFVPCGLQAAEAPLKLEIATRLGTEEDDDIEGVAAAADGSIYLAGNTGKPVSSLPVGAKPVTLGEPAKEPKCGCGFVARLSPDAKSILDYVQFAPGVALLTTVEVHNQGVYAGGYASAALEPLVKDLPGLMRQYPLVREVELIRAGKIAEANGIPDGKDPLADRPGLGRYGAPCVLRFSRDLQSLQCGTYLEGWQQVWDKVRVITTKPKFRNWPREFFWQPTSLGLLSSGDLVVCHDGGYFRLITDKERQEAKGDKEVLRRLGFYDCCDWLSRLSPDLSHRTWKQPIYTPAVNLEAVERIKPGWPYAHYSSPRTTRMRLDARENIYLSGWSATATAKEPYWSPYLWKMSSGDGGLLWKAYEHDPMSGRDNRLDGDVADTAVTTLALDGNGNVLSGLLSDGGNTVMGWSPAGELHKRFEKEIKGGWYGGGLVHWWGMIHRVDADSREGLGGARLGRTAWAVDLAALPGNHVLAAGRCNGRFDWTPNAWQQGDTDENPTAFLRLYSPTFDLLLSTAIRGVVPFELRAIGHERYALVGRADRDTAPVQDALCPKPLGKSDGYLMILQWKE